MPQTLTAFALPDRLAAKADPALIADDDDRFHAIQHNLDRTRNDVRGHLDAERRKPGGGGQAALERDQEIHRLSARLRALERYGLDLCIGRMVLAGDAEPQYIGRLGLTDGEGDRLLIDWRSPAAAPFFGATHADPMGLVSRRRYRWTRGRITDYWDEVFTAEALATDAALDDQSAFIASLGADRSERMRDVLATIQSDQDEIIRAESRQALVVDGGPGTGKTVVALHRTAYLLYSDPRLARAQGGVLFVGPHRAYLNYVADVLPSLGEESVQVATLADLVPEGATAGAEPDARVAALKASRDLVAAVGAAVALREQPPAEGMTVETPWADVWLDASDWADAFVAAEPGVPHNDARDQVWEALLEIVIERYADDVPPAALRRALAQNDDLRAAFGQAWPVLDPAGVVADLLSVPGYLRRSAPGLAEEEVALLQRADPRAWTTSDLPLLDAARARVGDPEAYRVARRRQGELAAERERVQQVVDYLVESHEYDDGEGVTRMLTGQDMQDALIHDTALSSVDPDELAGPFAHVVVDEAQELTDAEWQMILRRCPSRSLTIVGDRAQARHGFPEPWADRLARAGVGRVALASLTINYRTPAEIMSEAEAVIRAAVPDANVPISVRSTGVPVRHAAPADRDRILDEWLTAHAEGEGVACVIGDPEYPGADRIRSLDPAQAKGLEFDLVVLARPSALGTGIEGAVDRYVAMTRATQELVMLE